MWGENKRPNTSMRSVLCHREEWVASDPREDAATEDQIGTRKQKRGENRHIDAFGLMLEIGRSGR
jgi:hypothetical protein